MSKEQLYLAVGVPMFFNAVLFMLLLSKLNGSIAELRDTMNQRFEAVNQRFDDMRDLWRAELRRVEEILDARLKHLERP